MKKLTLFLLIFSILLNGCSLSEKGDEILTDVKDSYDNVVEGGKEAIETLKETKEKIEETVQDVENAVDAVGNAVDAIEEIKK